MRASTKVLLLTALLATVWAHDANAEKKTVCSITVNSPDEKETFRRSLPADKYQFVELVERGRPDWLESACRQGIRCDVLVIPGPIPGATKSFPDRVGPTAASMRDRYFQSGAGGEIGSGRASARMLGRFSANSMVVTSGLNDSGS